MQSLLLIALCVGLVAAKDCFHPYTGHDDNLITDPPKPYYIDHYKPGYKFKLACKSGYSLYDNNVDVKDYVKDGYLRVTCGFSGDYTPPIPDRRYSCKKRATCTLELTEALIVKPDKTVFNVGETLEFTCEDGYYLDGRSRVTCYRAGRFTSRIPVCLPRCKIPVQDYLKVNYDDESTRIGGYIDLDCAPGYRLRDGVEVTRFCQENGMWDPAIEKNLCIKKGCPKPPPSTENGSNDAKDKANKDGWFSVGVKVIYQCDKNYYFNTEKNFMICSARGTWFYNVPKCIEARCDDDDLMIKNGDYEKKKTSYSVGESIRYTCERGYKLSTKSGVRFCRLNSGGKSADFEKRPTCERIECSKPMEIDNGSFLPGASTKFYIGSKVAYTCDDGYYRDGNEMAVCLLDEGGMTASFTDPPSCEEIRCDKPMPLDNGDFKPEKSSYPLGDSIKFTCDEYHYRDGPEQARCVKNPRSETKGMFTKFPECVEIRCKKPMKPRFGGFTPEEADYAVKEEIKFFCVKNYKLVPSNEVRKCLVNRDGKTASFGSIPTCQRIECDEPDKPANGDFSPKQKNYYVGDDVTYECDPGYYLDGDELNICKLNDDEVSASFKPAPLCKPIMCNDPMSLPNGKIIEGIKDDYTIGDTVVYECDDTHYMSGSDTAECKQSGPKSGKFTPAPRCIEITCDDPMDIANGGFTSKPRYVIDDTVEYSCDINYKLVGNPTATCKKTGPKTAKFSKAPRCEEILCDDPMELDNGDFDPSDPEGPYPVGTVIKYRCDRGYKFGTRYTSVTCQLQPDKMSAKFSKLPVCERVYCMFPGEPANGKTTPKKVRYIVDETVEFQCDKCYSRKGASSATCQQNGQFSAPVPSCNIIKCAKTKIDIPYKGYLAVPKKEYNCGERVDFKCEYGYRRVGVGSTVCRSNGAFDPSETTCEAITCKLVITDKNVRVSPYKPGLEYFVDDTVKFHCKLGYEIKKGDPTSSICEVSGDFSNPAPSCIPVTCGKPPVPKYGSIVDYDGETSYKPGSYVEYQCKIYYTLAYDESGGSNLCLHDGTWKYPAPKCLPPSCDGYCFADKIKGRDCQCDHACDDKDRKDCCDDRQKYCSTKSCGGRCGTRGPGCSCHISCRDAGKNPSVLPCCRDFYAGCNDWYQF